MLNIFQLYGELCGTDLVYVFLDSNIHSSRPTLIPLSRARRGSFGATDMASIVHRAVLQDSLNTAPIPDLRSSVSQKDNSVLGSDNPITNIEVPMSRAGVLSRLSKISGSQVLTNNIINAGLRVVYFV